MDDVREDRQAGRGRPQIGDRAREVAARIAQARVLAGLSIADCTAALGMSKNQYTYIERQCSTRQETAYLDRMAELFKVSREWLASGDKGTGAPPSAAGDIVDSAERAQWLGDRARARREELSLSRNAVCERIGASAMNLICWEKSLPRRRRPIEEEWEKVLCVPPGWLRNTALQPYPPPSFPGPASVEGVTVAQEMRAVVGWFSRQNRFQRTTDLTALNASEKRMAEIMLWRFGVYGEDGSTLQHIGDCIGLTRERVRQIEEDFVANLDDTVLATPVTDALRETLQSSLPGKVEDLDRAFRGLLGESLSLVGVDRFAREVLGKSVVKIIRKPANMQGYSEPVAVPDDTPDDDVVRAVRQIALAMVRTCGAAQLHYVTGIASADLGRGLMPDYVLQCCRLFSKFEWLIEEDGWFWFGPDTENRARTAALKVLSVATRNVDVEEIHDAMSRARMTRYEADRPRLHLLDAPLPVLREVLRRIPGIEQLQYNDFRLDVLVSPEEVLSGTEMAILRVIQRHGGVAARRTIAEEVLADIDVTLMAVNFALDGSPIFVRLDKGMWGVRGNRVDHVAVAGAQASVGYSGKGVRYIAQSPVPEDGWWRIRVRLPDSAFSRRHWIVPVAVECLLQPGEYMVEGFSEPANYVVASNPTLCAFVGKLIAMGIQPKEVFSLGIHESDKRLRIERVAQAEALPDMECGERDGEVD